MSLDGYGRTPATSDGSSRHVSSARRDPQRSVRDENRAAALAREAYGAIGPRIDAHERHAGRADPDRAGTGRNLAGPGGRRNRDRRHDLVGRRIDAGDAAIAAIERPHGAFAHRDAARLGTNGDRFDRLIGVRIDAGEAVVLLAGHPERLLPGRDRDRHSCDIDFGHRGVGLGIDPREHTAPIGERPEAAHARRDPAVGGGDVDGCPGRGLLRFQIETGDRVFAAQRDPHAAERDLERRAWSGANRDRRSRPRSSCCRSARRCPRRLRSSRSRRRTPLRRV